MSVFLSSEKQTSFFSHIIFPKYRGFVFCSYCLKISGFFLNPGMIKKVEAKPVTHLYNLPLWFERKFLTLQVQYSISHNCGQRNRASLINSFFLPTLKLNLGCGKGEDLCQKADSMCWVISASQLQFPSADCSCAFKTLLGQRWTSSTTVEKYLIVNKQEMQQTTKLAFDGDLRWHLLSQC